MLVKIGYDNAKAEIGKRNFLPANTRATTDPFTACMSDATLGNPHIKILVGTDTIQVDGNAKSWVVFNGVPGSCMAQVDSYNAHPNITDLNSIHGTVKDINSTSLLLYGMPQSIFAQLQAKVNN
jgi:hypothetical protein